MRDDTELFKINGVIPDYEYELVRNGFQSKSKLLKKVSRIVGKEFAESMSHEELINFVNGG